MSFFFLAPRLVEFPDAEFIDEILIPTQSPYEQSWKKISLGALRQGILDSISEITSPLAHTHSWESITGKPLAFTPSAHSHNISAITGLSESLSGKEPGLGVPDTDGKILSSTASGVRSWINKYVLPVATASVLGGIMIGTGFNASAQGLISHADFSIEDGIGGTLGHIKASERAAWNNHKDDNDKHLSVDERAYFNKLKTYLKFAVGNTSMYSTLNFYSESGVSSFGIGSGGSSGGGADLYNGLDKTEPGMALDAYQGYVLYGLINGKAASVHSHAWSDITGKPSVFSPSAHSHTKSDITDFAHTHSDIYYTKTEIGEFFSGAVAITGYAYSNWNSAFNWGNHASAGYASTSALNNHINNVSPHLSVAEREYLTKLISYLKISADNTSMYSTLNFYSESGVSAFGIGSGGSSGGAGVNVINDLVHSTYDSSEVLAAYQGYVLNTRIDTREPAFAKNTAFNKNFGASAGTVAEGNDSRIVNGQTAYGWGNHALAGYALAGHSHTYFYNGNSFGGDCNALAEDYKLSFTSLIVSSATNLFPIINNANAIISIATHSGGYNHQLGFSSNGHIYSRQFSGGNAYNWLTIWDSGNLLNIGATASSARTALQLGTMATEAASNYLNLTNGGTITGDLTISKTYPILNWLSSDNSAFRIILADGYTYLQAKASASNQGIIAFSGLNGEAIGGLKVRISTGTHDIYHTGNLTNTLSNGYLPYWNNGNLANSALFQLNGNVGIGYTDRSEKFAVNGSGYFNGRVSIMPINAWIPTTYATLTLGARYAGEAASLAMGQSDTDKWHIDVYGGDMSWWRNNGSWYERMRLFANGNFHIGYNSDQNYTLAVNGSMLVNSISRFNGSIEVISSGLNAIKGNRIWSNGTGTNSGFSLDGILIYQASSGNLMITKPSSYPTTMVEMTSDIFNVYGLIRANQYRFNAGSYEINIYGDRFSFSTEGIVSAVGVNMGSLLVSNSWADSTNVPINGIWSRGGIESISFLKGTSIKIGNSWEATQNGTSLDLSYGGVLKARLDSSGNITAVGGITAFAI